MGRGTSVAVLLPALSVWEDRWLTGRARQPDQVGHPRGGQGAGTPDPPGVAIRVEPFHHPQELVRRVAPQHRHHAVPHRDQGHHRQEVGPQHPPPGQRAHERRHAPDQRWDQDERERPQQRPSLRVLEHPDAVPLARRVGEHRSGALGLEVVKAREQGAEAVEGRRHRGGVHRLGDHLDLTGEARRHRGESAQVGVLVGQDDRDRGAEGLVQRGLEPERGAAPARAEVHESGRADLAERSREKLDDVGVGPERDRVVGEEVGDQVAPDPGNQRVSWSSTNCRRRMAGLSVPLPEPVPRASPARRPVIPNTTPSGARGSGGIFTGWGRSLVALRAPRDDRGGRGSSG